MIKYPGQQLNDHRAGSIVDTVIENQYFFSLAAGEQRKRFGNVNNQSQSELSPVVPRIIQEIIDGNLIERQIKIGDDDSPVKIVAIEGQHEDYREKCHRRYSSQFPYAAFIEQGADLKILTERIDSSLQPICFLSVLMLSDNIHTHPSFLILLMFSQKTIYQKAKGFLAIIALFQIHISFFGGTTSQVGKLSNRLTKVT